MNCPLCEDTLIIEYEEGETFPLFIVCENDDCVYSKPENIPDELYQDAQIERINKLVTWAER